MSTKINRKKFTELIRTLIQKEIKEVSTTATAGGEYDTPNAFQSKGNEKRKKIAKTGTDFKVVEGKWAVTVAGVGKIIIDATGAGQARTMVGRSLKKGMKGIVSVKRVQSAFGKQIDKKTESVVEGRLSSYQKKAILIAIQMSGNMTNAVKKIEKIKKGLSKDKKVKDALRLANESVRVLAIKEGVKTSKAFNNFQKSRSSFLERWGKLKKQLNTIKTESPNNEYLRLEKQLYKFETAFIEQSAKIMSSVSKISKSNLTESVNKGKLSEDYKNSEWEVYVADENGKEKIVKKAKSKRAGVILYNKLINSDNYYEVGMRVVKESVNEANNIDKIKDILKNKSMKKISGVVVDMQTANAIVTVHKALGQSNRKKFEKLPIKKMASVAWKLVK